MTAQATVTQLVTSYDCVIAASDHAGTTIYIRDPDGSRLEFITHEES